MRRYARETYKLRRMDMKAIVTVVGQDRKGIIAKVSNILFENDINIVDISQTIMQDMFTMIMMVEFDDNGISVHDIEKKLTTAGKEMGLTIHVQRREIFTSMHRI
jgi:ACT domain-containing protein